MGSFVKDVGSGLVTGPATIVSGIMQSKAQNKATEASERSNAAALAFTKEQEAQRQKVYNDRMAQWTASRNALLERYGIDIAPPSAAPAGPAVPGAVPRPQPGPAMAQGAPQGLQGATLGEIMQSKQAPGLDSWNDWQAQGINRA